MKMPLILAVKVSFRVALEEIVKKCCLVFSFFSKNVQELVCYIPIISSSTTCHILFSFPIFYFYLSYLHCKGRCTQ